MILGMLSTSSIICWRNAGSWSISSSELPVVPDVVSMPPSSTSMAKLVSSESVSSLSFIGVRIMSLNRSSPSCSRRRAISMPMFEYRLLMPSIDLTGSTTESWIRACTQSTHSRHLLGIPVEHLQGDDGRQGGEQLVAQLGLAAAR